jgi:hypothetical protein
MNTEQFDNEIARLESEAEAVRREMEVVTHDYLQAIVAPLADWFRRDAERAVMENHERAVALGQDGLGKIKEELTRLIQRLPVLVHEHIDRDLYWTHRQRATRKVRSASPSYDSDYTRSFARPAEVPSRTDGLREVLGYLGELLINNGFATADKNSVWKITPGSPRPRWGIGFGPLSTEVTEIEKRYAALCSKLSEFPKAIEQVEKRKSEAIAKDLWNRA